MVLTRWRFHWKEGDGFGDLGSRDAHGLADKIVSVVVVLWRASITSRAIGP